MSDGDKRAYISWVEKIEFFGDIYDLDISNSVNRLLMVLRGERQVITSVPSMILELRHRVSDELAKHRFMYMPDDESRYYEQEELFGNGVFVSIPEVRLDVRASGNCIACGLYTASVYHLMRVAEFGLRRIAKRLKVKLSDRGKRITVEYATWNDVITACNNKITDVRRKPVGKQKEKLLIFYSDAAQHCLFMKDIWRNNLSHTREPYIESEAVAALDRVKYFMKFLAVNGI